MPERSKNKPELKIKELENQIIELKSQLNNYKQLTKIIAELDGIKKELEQVKQQRECNRRHVQEWPISNPPYSISWATTSNSVPLVSSNYATSTNQTW